MQSRRQRGGAGACQRQSVPFRPFPDAVLDPAGVWVGFKSFLTAPVGGCDASPWRELWEMVSGSGLARLGWRSPTNGESFPMDSPSPVPTGRVLLCPFSNTQNPQGAEIINPNPAPFPPLFPPNPLCSSGGSKGCSQQEFPAHPISLPSTVALPGRLCNSSRENKWKNHFQVGGNEMQSCLYRDNKSPLLGFSSLKKMRSRGQGCGWRGKD